MFLDSAVVDGDPVAAAAAVALRHTGDDAAGLRRVKRGSGFVYLDADGAVVRDPATLSRIRALAIPPAWTGVWIAADPRGHIQATGRDARGRKQYRYHARWRDVRDAAKYHRLVAFCQALPRLRAAVARDLACDCLCKTKVIATIVALMERAQLRVGNEEYARDNGSYGATTLRDRHARIQGDTLVLAYRAKGGVPRRVRITDRRLTRIVRRCRDLPGQRLFQYVDGDEIHPITSTDVNDYLREVTGGPFTAKDYRTWAATMGAAWLLCAQQQPANQRECKRCIKQVIDAVAEQLGHTPAVCRASYIHPQVIEDFTANKLGPLARRLARRRRLADPFAVETLRAIEPAVARYLAAAAQIAERAARRRPVTASRSRRPRRRPGRSRPCAGRRGRTAP
jgi:DNA topoisomerase-1